MPLALLAMLVVQLNFGLLPVAQKTVLSLLTPGALFGLRTAAGALSFSLLYGLWRWIKRPQLQRAEALVPARVFLFLSLLGISANQFLLILALTMTSSIAAVIMVPSITLFTFLFAILLGRERFSAQRAATLLLGACGVVILFADSWLDLAHGLAAQAFVGNGLCLISAMVYALYLVLSRDWSGKLPALQFTSRLFAYSLVWTALLLMGLALWQQPSALAGFFLHDPPQLLAGFGAVPQRGLVYATLVFIVLGPTVLNYFLNFWSLRYMPASTVSGFISLQTLIGAAVSALVLHEEWKSTYAYAAACILISIGLLSWQTLRRPAVALPAFALQQEDS